MHADIERVLIAEDVILRRLDEVAKEILEDYQGRPILMMGIMKGALVLLADLFRRLPVSVEVEFIHVASYHGGVESSGKVDFLDAALPDVTGRCVLLVDDILDTGRTLAAVSERLREAGAEQVRSCVLLTKDKERAIEVEADYSCFGIGDEFVVGYGLDFGGRYRNLPYVGILKSSAVS